MTTYDRLQMADDNWMRLLSRQYGRDARNVRYRPEGIGEPNTPLRAAYEAYRALHRRWNAERVSAGYREL